MKFGKEGNLCLSAIICDRQKFNDWMDEKVIYLVKERMFTSSGMTEERNSFAEEYYEERRLLTAWNALTDDEKWNIFRHHFFDGRTVTYEEYRKHLRIEEEVGDYMIFNALDGFLDPDDESLYIKRGTQTINLSKAIRFLDPNHKYTQAEMMQVYHAILPLLKRDETSSETENKEAEN